MKAMKRVFGRFTKVLLATALFVMLLGVSASAANYKVNMTKGSNGVYTYIGKNFTYQDSVYHKVTVPKDGLLVVTGGTVYQYSSGYYSLNVELYNSSLKKRLNCTSYKDSVNVGQEKAAYYGVKKGTYYIKVSGVQNYALAASFQGYTNKGGSSKAKAYTIKKQKRTQFGVMPAGEKAKAVDWYKFKVTKKKVLHLDIEAVSNGPLEFYLFGPSYSNYKKGIRICSFTNGSGSYYSINASTRKKIKVKTGTYYIKVARQSSSYYKNASGAYSIKWYLK